MRRSHVVLPVIWVLGACGDLQEGLDASASDEGSIASFSVPVGVELNPGWIGGACDGAGDCASAKLTSSPICETEGFAGGMCTQACLPTTSGRYVCPDEQVDGTSYTLSRCIADEEGAPRCVAQCDYGKSATGCRPGYTCVLEQRFNTTTDDRIYPVCVPSDGQRWPGASMAPFDIGAACSTSAQCGDNACVDGVCAKVGCDFAGCPTGAECVKVSDDPLRGHVCKLECDRASDCAEGHSCVAVGDTKVCAAGVTPQPGPGVGAIDCAQAWGVAGSGLHRCDATKDDYVVINKTARNVAVCTEGRWVKNIRGSLGFRPFGDKEVEGDGKTPEGVFYVPRTLPNSHFYKAYLFSYPDKDDAARGLAAGLIDEVTKRAIDTAQDACREPPQTTPLGGYVELHGRSSPTSGDWTLGCVAVTDAAMDELWALIGAKDTVVIKP